MEQLLGVLGTLGALAFLTAPIWYPTWAATRAIKAWEKSRQQSRR